MARKDRTTGMKSAWEIAQERMAEKLGDSETASRPLTDAIKQEMAECRREAEAKLAELEILQGNPLADPMASEEKKSAYLRERRFVEQTLEEKLESLRRS